MRAGSVRSASNFRRCASAHVGLELAALLLGEPECELLDVALVVAHLGTHAASLGLEDLAQAPRLQVAANAEQALAADEQQASRPELDRGSLSRNALAVRGLGGSGGDCCCSSEPVVSAGVERAPPSGSEQERRSRPGIVLLGHNCAGLTRFRRYRSCRADRAGRVARQWLAGAGAGPSRVRELVRAPTVLHPGRAGSQYMLRPVVWQLSAPGENWTTCAG